jgi:hypothetical protein
MKCDLARSSSDDVQGTSGAIDRSYKCPGSCPGSHVARGLQTAGLRTREPGWLIRLWIGRGCGVQECDHEPRVQGCWSRLPGSLLNRWWISGTTGATIRTTARA